MSSRGIELQPEPDRHDLLAMAYADGELPPDERLAFEALLVERPELALEVAEFERLAVMARQCVPPEPMDLEWRSLSRDATQRALERGGRLLCGLGAAGLLAWLGLELAASSIAIVGKLALFSCALGALFSWVALARARARTRRLDPYTDVVR